MKEFVLSLLSRGCSHVVQTDGSSQCGRLEVCFEPEDYFNWKSQPPLLRLSGSSRMLSGVEPTPPKTYSTRRGPLLLYSEDFALSTRRPERVSKKEKAFQSSREEADGQLHTLQDLTEAALAYGVKQARPECPTTITQPLFSLPKQTTKHLQLPYNRTEEKWNYVTHNTGEEREEHTSHLNFTSFYRPVQVRYQPRFMCSPQPHRPPPGPLPVITPKPAPRCSVDRPHLAPGEPASFKSLGQEDHPITKDRKTSCKEEVWIPRVQMSPIPEFDAWEEGTEQHEDQKVIEHLTGFSKDVNSQWKQNSIEKGGEEGVCSLKTTSMDLSLGSSHLSKVFNDRKHTEGQHHPVRVKHNHTVELNMSKINKSFNSKYNSHHLPPIMDFHPLGSDLKEQELKTGNTRRENCNESVPRLPDIHQPNVSTETTTSKALERPLLKKVLVLPPLPERHDSLHGLPGEMEDVLRSEVEQNGESIKREESRPIEDGCRLNAAEKDHLVWFEPELDKEHQMTLGPLPPFVGRRGLGKQCSMALYRQDPCDPADQSESGIIRGSLPLELRECQKGGVLGTLIMGPAGEIIRLSFWDSLTDTEDHPAQQDAIREHVLRVMTSQGVLEQPWTILLEDQTSQTGEINESESKAKQDHREKHSINHEDRALAGHIKGAETAEHTGTDLGRIREAQGSLHAPAHLYTVCAPEKRSEKINHTAENPPYSKEKDIKRQIRGRTQSLQPKERGTPGSPEPTSMSANSPQKSDLPAHRATDDRFHTQNSGHKTQTELLNKNVKNPEKSSKSRKVGAGHDVEDAQVRKRKKKDINQSIKETTDESAENERAQSNTDTNSEDTSFTTGTSPATTAKTNREPGETVNKESINSQNHVKKARKTSKGQAAFVVGKPKQSQKVQQTEKRAYSSDKSHKKGSSTSVNVREDDPTNGYSRDSTGHTVNVMDTDQDSVFQVNHEAGPNLYTDSVFQENPGARPALDMHEMSISREDRVAGQNDDGQVSDYQESYISAVSSRSHSSVSKSSTATWSYHRTSVRTDSVVCSPEPFSRTNVSACCAAPTHQSASHPAKSESITDVKVSNEVIIARDRRAAALAEKAERRRQEVDKKRKEKEEERMRQQEREEREDKMRQELEEDQKHRTEQAKLRKLQEEEEKQRQVKRELEQQKRERAEVERERRKQEEKRRLVDRIQKQKREEEARRAAELKHQQQEEEARREEEWRRLQEMDEGERLEYLRRQKEEEEIRRKAMEERRRAEKEAAMRAEEEARLLAELFTRQRAELEKQLQFHRGLLAEAEGLEQTQDVSRPWVYSYFSLLKMLGLTDCNAV